MKIDTNELRLLGEELVNSVGGTQIGPRLKSILFNSNGLLTTQAAHSFGQSLLSLCNAYDEQEKEIQRLKSKERIIEISESNAAATKYLGFPINDILKIINIYQKNCLGGSISDFENRVASCFSIIQSQKEKLEEKDKEIERLRDAPGFYANDDFYNYAKAMGWERDKGQ